MSDSNPPPQPGPALSCNGLSRSFEEGGTILKVLEDIDFVVAPAERVAIVGASGSGKSTLLQLLGGLDDPTSGSVHVAGQAMNKLTDADRGRIRNQAIGFVYQFHHLLPEFTAVENVAMPLLVRRQSPVDARAAATALLRRVGLGERLTHRPGQLSGGERQRAAVARALITRPAVVLADEPTGNLDLQAGERVLGLMLELNEEFGTSLVIATHDPGIAARMQRTLLLSKGRLQTQK
ncbi:MAG: ATP-binding cassette domain-containing protein [Gammaproteobacteria bacterium]